MRPSASEAPAQTKELLDDSHKEVYLKGSGTVAFSAEGPLLGDVRHLSTPEGDVEADVLAELSLPESYGSSTDKILIAYVEDRWSMVALDKGGLVSKAQDIADGKADMQSDFANPQGEKFWRTAAMSVRDKSGQYFFNLRYEFGKSTDDKAKLSVNKELDLGSKRTKSAAESSRGREAWVRRGKRALGVTALLATGMSGGLIDRAAAPFADNDNVVAEAAESISPLVWGMEDTIDGIKIAELDDPQQALDELNAPLEERLLGIEAATRAVQETIEDLDNHNYQAIRARADRYLEQNQNALIPAGQVEAVRQAVSEAETTEAAISAVRPVAEHYDLDIRYQRDDSGEVNLSEAKHTLTGIVNALSALPKPLVDDANLNIITVASSEAFASGDSDGHASTRGRYKPGSNEIVMRAVSGPVERVISSISIPGVQPGSMARVENVFMHEFAHSADALGWHRDNSTPLQYAPIDLIRGLANYPEVISTYSRTNDNEGHAEDMAGVLADRKDGLAHPDETRRFHSPANRAMLGQLIELEASYPGIVDYMIAVNDRLMNRSALTIGR